MMKSSIERALEEMNKLQRTADKYNDRSYETYHAGNIKASDIYEKKADDLIHEINGMKTVLKLLGFGVWADSNGHWHIPRDDIERAI